MASKKDWSCSADIGLIKCVALASLTPLTNEFLSQAASYSPGSLLRVEIFEVFGAGEAAPDWRQRLGLCQVLEGVLGCLRVMEEIKKDPVVAGALRQDLFTLGGKGGKSMRTT
jgi:hypothetical protein